MCFNVSYEVMIIFRILFAELALEPVNFEDFQSTQQHEADRNRETRPRQTENRQGQTMTDKDKQTTTETTGDG